MTLTRRNLLQAVLTLPLINRLPWVPKPAPIWPMRHYGVSIPITLEEINRITMQTVMPGVIARLNEESPVLAYLRAGLPLRPTPPQQLALPGVDWTPVDEEWWPDEDEW